MTKIILGITGGIGSLTTSELFKEIILNWIYRVKSSNFDVPIDEFEGLINKYIEGKDVPVILGCTELPLLANPNGLKKDVLN